jgi:hypothetical protein
MTHPWFEQEDEFLLEDLATPRRWRHPPTGAGLSLLWAVAVVALLFTVLFEGLR